MDRILTKESIRGITPYPLGIAAEELKEKYKLSRIRSLADNENAYGCSKLVSLALSKQAGNLSRYPDGACSALKRTLGNFLNLPSEYISIGNGSEELIRLLARAYISEGDEAIMADLTFPRYKANVVIEGGKAVEVPLKDGLHDLVAMGSRMSSRTKMIFICNPNNPTGTALCKEAIQQFIAAVPAHILIVLDEAYYEYMNHEKRTEAEKLLTFHDNVAVLRTFSKAYGLAGLRAGYGMMHPSIIAELDKVREVFNVNALSQAAAIAALEDQYFVRMSGEKNRTERGRMRGRIEELGFMCYASEANFLFIQGALAEKLMESGIIVRKFTHASFQGEAVRLTIGTEEDNDAVLEAIGQAVRGRRV
ncbi:histidinol-phosphate transaminase [Bacillus infantis]|uniref:histidinol-phosphate transaminase n=1 Tax=Bacillus infantis TaxID=324767 RepID=UPI003CEEAD05